MGNKHWQSFGELNQTEAFTNAAKDEFREDLPFAADDKGLLDAVSPRRDFLKYLGFSTAAAAIAASCEIPVRRSIPFANKPEDIVPGTANFYATTYVQDGDAVSILAKVRDGRPIKIEGNELSPVTNGGTSARVQASVLDLYDTARLRYPFISSKQNEVTFEAIDRSIAADLAGLGGAPVVVLTSTVTSPSAKAIIQQFISKYPGGGASRHVQYDAVSCSGMLLANKASYGRQAIPSYRFDNARVIVSLAADFLGTWLSPVEFSVQYAGGRKINEKNPGMSRHIQFESVLSMTGANADERYIHRPSETGAIAVALRSAVNGSGATGIADAGLKAGIEKTAKFLIDNKGYALVVCGSNDPNIQIVVNAINEAIGANGKTIDWGSILNYRQGIDSEFAQLVEDMNAGRVGALLVHGANPVYSWYDGARVASGLKKTRVTLSFCGKNDETTQLCKYVVPDSHYLESWGDAEPKSGNFSLMQPTIYPLFKTRQWQDSLLKWSGDTTDYLTYLKTFWLTPQRNALANEGAWNKALQDGVFTAASMKASLGSGKGNEISDLSAVATAVNDKTSMNFRDSTIAKPAIVAPVLPAGATATAFAAGAVEAAIAAINSSPAAKSGTELFLYQKIAIGAGQGTSNPWLQELPDPITRATWDNYIIISPAKAKSLLGIDLAKSGDADDYEVHPEKRVLKVSAGNKTVELPFLIVPGTHPDTIGIAVGYGRHKELGKSVEGSGKNVFHFASLAKSGTISFTLSAVTLEKTDDTYPLALAQTHNIYNTPQGNRTEVLKELSLAEFKAKPTEILDEREEELKPFGGLEKYEKGGTIYPYHEKPGIKWGMSVDLNSCTGCGACVIACNSENNIAVVGKYEVQRFHDMHWLRIDRYYSGADMDNPNVTFQPMLCQHCDNAPCENVCPVDATNHSSEGLNQMAYNRCIGTRYCANNCPYKVRRFNWADYTGADSFPNNQDILGDVVNNMNDPLTRMVINPDVTVRSHGVMEKCSFCVQRLQEGKLKAKKESRPLKSGENNEWDVKTACQQACPSDCFTFGNVNDPNSAISQVRKDNPNRLFHVIEMLHTLPNVNYLAKVRNVEEAIGAHKEGEGSS